MRLLVLLEMNEVSSRSHTIFQVNLERVCDIEAEVGIDTRLDAVGVKDKVIRRSKINLVDLAGSEKWRVHDADTLSEQRIQELTAINQSLSTLGNVISALLQPGRTHIPVIVKCSTHEIKNEYGQSLDSFKFDISSSLTIRYPTLSVPELEADPATTGLARWEHPHCLCRNTFPVDIGSA